MALFDQRFDQVRLLLGLARMPPKANAVSDATPV